MDKISKANDEVAELKTVKAQNESQMQQDAEEINSIKGQFGIKIKQCKDLDLRAKRA